ncbi:MAG: hypothetical protein SGPRY_014941, partial [Prymnesium sp.]
LAPAEPEAEGSLWEPGGGEQQPSVWGDDVFGSDWIGAVDKEASEGDVSSTRAWSDGSWADADASGSWDDDEGDSSLTADWLSPAPEPKVVRAQREIECTNIGIVATPFKRRNGIYAEVTVQHKEAEATVTTLWFTREVLENVANLRARDPLELKHEPFAEEVVRYLRDMQGVDFSDPDWGLADDDIPFTTQSTAVKGSPEAALEEEALKENKEDPMSDSEEETP